MALLVSVNIVFVLDLAYKQEIIKYYEHPLGCFEDKQDIYYDKLGLFVSFGSTEISTDSSQSIS